MEIRIQFHYLFVAKSEQHLLQLFEKYSQITPTIKFFEPDVDEFTSICLYARPQIRKSLSHLPLTLKNLSVVSC
jgi:predicted dithiol-disulfide oxidoreductase (DUF899 family)